MNKIIIALGFTLAASTGAFAASTAMDAYDFPAAQTSGIDYTATASTGAGSNDQVVYHRAGNDGSPTFKAPTAGVDYTATASVGGVSNDQIIYDRAGNDGSPHFAR
ncbi:hypothetical protein OEG84_20240 [Hoeflea sp. G2-23]|uniref:Uncharacterized protein n=1 Tax=Hoeflea algicola TaxID=2983763 RepID=A0ABT3ZDU8_9HYPH|nr:hypothetical protein [Hoeflea algicola]MCY0149966.1 hypothetical protein [Hoeflea algicola]